MGIDYSAVVIFGAKIKITNDMGDDPAGDFENKGMDCFYLGYDESEECVVGKIVEEVDYSDKPHELILLNTDTENYVRDELITRNGISERCTYYLVQRIC